MASVGASGAPRSRCTSCCRGGPGTRARNCTSTRPATASCSEIPPFSGHRRRNPRRARGRARRCGAGALHDPDSFTGPARGSAPRWRPGALRAANPLHGANRLRGANGLWGAIRMRGRRPGGSWRRWPGGANSCSATPGGGRLHAGRAALHLFGLPGVRHGVPGRDRRGRRPKPRSEAFRRALEGTLASGRRAGQTGWRRTNCCRSPPNWTAPARGPERGSRCRSRSCCSPVRRWSPRDPLHTAVHFSRARAERWRPEGLCVSSPGRRRTWRYGCSPRLRSPTCGRAGGATR